MFEPTEITATPSGAGPFAVSADWVEQTLTGSFGTTVAILAIAGVGLALLQGRLAVRDGARALLGCFILFGAPFIARGLADLSAAPTPAPAGNYGAPPPPPIVVPKAPQPDRDPYAGASVPM